MDKPVVAIVGRPNVGKSTFFNRVIGKRHAIVDDQSGITRDRNYSESDWNGVSFSLIDTGGMVPKSQDVMEKAIAEQVLLAIEEADVILMMVDVVSGITDLDLDIARELKRSSKKVFLIVNKVDNEQRELEVGRFYKLGLGEPFSVSSMEGRKVGDLLDQIIEHLPKPSVPEEKPDPKIFQLAVIGKPNVGKSSLINAILGKDRQIVTEIPGTTRDSIDTRIQYYGRELSLIDTAGLRRKPKVIENVEFFSTVRTRKSIERCDVALVLFDCDEGLATQDIRIIGEALELKKGVVLVGNKWDLIEKNVQTAADFEKALQERLADLDFVPIIFISAKLKQRVFKVIELALQVNEERNKKLTTSQLNKVLQPVFERQPPSAAQGKHVSIQYVNQVKSKPPVFAFYGNEPGLITPQYRKFMERQLREHFGFKGVPLSLTFKEK